MGVWDRVSERMATRPPPSGALNGLLRMRRGLRRTRELPLPAHAVMIERSLAFVECAAVSIAAELDLAELVASGETTTDELARRTGADPDALGRLLEVLADSDVFARDGPRKWRLTRLSETLRDDHPNSIRAWARFFGGPEMFGIWAEAGHAVRTGGSATAAATGHEFFDYVHEVAPEVGERFDAAMGDGARALARSFVEVVDLEGVETVCDVGGGTGTLVRALLERHPTMRATVFDLPEVIERARRDLAGLDRVDLVAGSFFESVPGAQRIVMVSILHDWDDERARAILLRCRDALPEGGRILAVEPTLDPRRPAFIERSTDLLMLVLTGAGRERTAEDFDALFASAGLQPTRTWLLASLQTVYELRTA